MKLEVIFEPEDYSDLIIERGIPFNDPYPQIVEGIRTTLERTVVEGGYFG